MAKKYPPAPCPVKNFQYYEWPRIDEPTQQATFLGHSTNTLFDGKVYLLFKLYGGAHDGQLVYLAKNADLVGKPGWGGAFRLGKRRDLFEQLDDVGLPDLRPGKRVNLAPLCGPLLDIELGPVEKNRKQQPIAPEKSYSVVRRIRGVQVGSLRA